MDPSNMMKRHTVESINNEPFLYSMQNWMEIAVVLCRDFSTHLCKIQACSFCRALFVDSLKNKQKSVHIRYDDVISLEFPEFCALSFAIWRCEGVSYFQVLKKFSWNFEDKNGTKRPIDWMICE